MPSLRARILRLTALWAPTLLVFAACNGANGDEHAIPRTPAPAGAAVYVVSPAPGSLVRSPVTVRFGLRGMGVAPAGVPSPNTGHHHLIVDAPLPPEDAAIPNDDQHLHFGGGQTEVEIELAPGEHSVQLVLGDHNHVPHQPVVASPVVRFTVLGN